METKYFLLGYYVMALAMTLVSCEKKNDSWLSFDYIAVQMSKGDNWSIIDKDGNEVVKEEYSIDAKISPVYDGAFWVYTNGKAQLYSVDQPKKPLIDEEFTNATRFEAGVTVVSNPNHPIRILNTKGETVATLANYIKRCGAFNKEGYAIILANNNKYGSIDKQGNIVIKPEYTDLESFAGDVLLAKENEDSKVWYILDVKGNKTGEIPIDENFTNKKFYSCGEGKIFVGDKNEEGTGYRCYVYDNTGKKLFEIKKANTITLDVYKDGFMPFGNDDDGNRTYGVVDNQGEIVIRAKYSGINNYGGGLFSVKKGDKWGVVNEKDEAIIGFSYDDAEYFRMGDSFLMKDGNDYSLIGEDGKEIVSFYALSLYSSGLAEYIDVDEISNGIIKFIEECEQPKTAAAYAKERSLSVDDYHYDKSFGRKLEYDNKVTGIFNINYQEDVTEEKTHIEQVNDGWFTNNITVSDGWGWTNALPWNVNGSFELLDNAGIEMKDIYSSVVKKLKDGRKKISDDTFSKNVKMADKIVECRVYCGLVGNSIALNISYHQ